MRVDEGRIEAGVDCCCRRSDRREHLEEGEEGVSSAKAMKKEGDARVVEKDERKMGLTDELGAVLSEDIFMLLDRVRWIKDISVVVRWTDVVVGLQKK